MDSVPNALLMREKGSRQGRYHVYSSLTIWEFSWNPVVLGQAQTLDIQRRVHVEDDGDSEMPWKKGVPLVIQLDLV